MTATYVMAAPGGGGFSNTTPVTIDDSPPQTVTSQILVHDVSGLPASLTVSIDIDHTYVSDLTITLIAPDGTRAILVSDEGSFGDNFADTTFDDSAASSITDGTPPFSGTFRPEEPLAPLAAVDPNGTWTLEIRDDEAPDGGRLNDWSLQFSPAWDAMDFGTYQIATSAGAVAANGGTQAVADPIGSFDVRIDDPSVLYVDTFSDIPGQGSFVTRSSLPTRPVHLARSSWITVIMVWGFLINPILFQRFLIPIRRYSSVRRCTQPVGPTRRPATWISPATSRSSAGSTT